MKIIVEYSIKISGELMIAT